MSREVPVLFRDELVRAILAGEKTVTRRVGPTWARVQPGDRLWVRETHALLWLHGDGPPEVESSDPRDDYYVEYRADGSPTRLPGRWPPELRRDPMCPRWRPSIHMPRWACRLELEVESVTEQQGWRTSAWGHFLDQLPDVDDAEARREGVADRAAFLALWRKLHPHHVGPVYRVEFRRVDT